MAGSPQRRPVYGVLYGRGSGLRDLFGWAHASVLLPETRDEFNVERASEVEVAYASRYVEGVEDAEWPMTWTSGVGGYLSGQQLAIYGHRALVQRLGWTALSNHSVIEKIELLAKRFTLDAYCFFTNNCQTFAVEFAAAVLEHLDVEGWETYKSSLSKWSLRRLTDLNLKMTQLIGLRMTADHDALFEMPKETRDKLFQIPENKKCANCSDQGPLDWALESNGTFICLACAGRLRGVDPSLFHVKSVLSDSWREKELLRMELGGNKNWAAFLREQDLAPERLAVANCDYNAEENKWILDLYHSYQIRLGELVRQAIWESRQAMKAQKALPQQQPQQQPRLMQARIQDAGLQAVPQQHQQPQQQPRLMQARTQVVPQQHQQPQQQPRSMQARTQAVPQQHQQPQQQPRIMQARTQAPRLSAVPSAIPAAIPSAIHCGAPPPVRTAHGASSSSSSTDPRPVPACHLVGRPMPTRRTVGAIAQPAAGYGGPTYSPPGEIHAPYSFGQHFPAPWAHSLQQSHDYMQRGLQQGSLVRPRLATRNHVMLDLDRDGHDCAMMAYGTRMSPLRMLLVDFSNEPSSLDDFIPPRRSVQLELREEAKDMLLNLMLMIGTSEKHFLCESFKLKAEEKKKKEREQSIDEKKGNDAGGPSAGTQASQLQGSQELKTPVKPERGDSCSRLHEELTPGSGDNQKPKKSPRILSPESPEADLA